MSHIQKYYNGRISECYVIFTKSEHWYQIFLKKDFGHLYLLMKDDFNWLVLNPRRLFLHWEILPIPASKDAWKIITSKSDHVIQINLHQRDNIISFGIFGFRTCTTLVQYMLGLKLKCVTPWSLFKRLLRLSTTKRKLHGISSITLKK